MGRIEKLTSSQNTHVLWRSSLLVQKQYKCIIFSFMYFTALDTILLLHSSSHVMTPENILPLIFVNISYVGICSDFWLCILVILCLWFRASQIYIIINQQDAAVRSQFYFPAGSLYMFRVLSTPIIRSTLNCIYSLRCRSCYRCSYLLPTWPNLL